MKYLKSNDGKSPINYFGGKARMAEKIVALFPPHKVYCEPFGGSAAVLFKKSPCPIEVYNDIDSELVNLFTVLRDKDLASELEQQLELTLYARAEFELAKTPAGDPVERARRMIVRQRQSFGSHGENWSFAAKSTSGENASTITRWRKGIDRIPAAVRRLSGVQIECCSWVDLIPRIDSESTLFYLDPPYVSETRVGGGYAHEMDEAQHIALVSMLLGIKGMAVLSGYDTPIYRPLDDAGWVRKSYETPAFSSDARAARTEVLWISPRIAKHQKEYEETQLSFE
jgi:DNA adenine methylase